MANRIFTNIKGINKNAILLGGQFSIAASGGAATKLKGLGWSAAKSATGIYDITLEDVYHGGLISCVGSIQAATAVDLRFHVISETVTSTKIIKVALLSGSTATEPAAVTVVNFQMMLANTSLPS